MAFNEMTDGAGLNQIGTRRLGVQAAPYPNVASEIFPVIPLEGPAAPPEYAYLQGARPCVMFDAAQGVAAQFSVVGLRNPENSGVIAVVERLIWEEAAGVTLIGLLRMGNGTPTEDDSTQGHFRDTRLGISQNRRATCLCFEHTAGAVSGQGMGRYTCQASTQLVIEGPFILGPGGFMSLGPEAADKDIAVTYFWTERPITTGELLGAVTS